MGLTGRVDRCGGRARRCATATGRSSSAGRRPLAPAAASAWLPSSCSCSRGSRTGFFTAQLGSVFCRAHPLRAEEARDQWSLYSHVGGKRIGHRLIHYMEERERLTERWHGAFRTWPKPLSLTWGMQDPVATRHVLDGLTELRPHATAVRFEGLGHYPRIEGPERVAHTIASLESNWA